ncbi:MAG: hypothetical protein HQK53_14410 [Oligoflexia bacterium]|nr:hypothetical protein [Oligoflexia bacterium]
MAGYYFPSGLSKSRKLIIICIITILMALTGATQTFAAFYTVDTTNTTNTTANPALILINTDEAVILHGNSIKAKLAIIENQLQGDLSPTLSSIISDDQYKNLLWKEKKGAR